MNRIKLAAVQMISQAGADASFLKQAYANVVLLTGIPLMLLIVTVVLL